MPQNTTDHIAKLAWNTTRERWREFMVLPTVVGLVFFGAIALITYLTPTQNSSALILIFGLLYLAFLVFCVVFFNALAQWCADLYAGKKVLDIEEGLRYGLSRFWGTVGTGLFTFLKIFLWSLLLILPGLYKALMYSQSVQVSQLEKISGGDANRISQKMISEAGTLRTLGNFMSLWLVTTIVFYISFALILLFSLGFAKAGSEILSGIITGGLTLVVMVFMNVFLLVFCNYQYLVYRDENKAALTSLTKNLKSMKS